VHRTLTLIPYFLAGLVGKLVARGTDDKEERAPYTHSDAVPSGKVGRYTGQVVAFSVVTGETCIVMVAFTVATVRERTPERNEWRQR
jgi:hypothetical protein